MIVENPTMDSLKNRPGYCAIRARKDDGTPNVGGRWVEPFGFFCPFVEDQKKWEVVFYTMDDISNLPK
jgi:hypothetical protein